MTISQLAPRAKWGGALRSIASTRFKFSGRFPGFLSRVPGKHLRNLMVAGLGLLMWQQAGATSSATLSWDANPEPDIAGYTINYGTAPGVYDRSLEAGNATETEVSGLVEGKTYYFAVAAFNQGGYRSPNSDEVSYYVEPAAPANQAPVASTVSASTSEGQSVLIALNATDADHDTLTFSVINPPTHGSLSGTPPNLTYTPAAAFNGSDSFTFKANDGKLDSNIATANLTISAINHAPIAKAAAVTTAEDTTLPVTLTATDSDNNPLTFTVSSGPSHGKLTGTAPNLVYAPNPNYNGPDQFSFTASDGSLVSAAAVITLTVTTVNDAPVVAGTTLTTQENKGISIQLTGSDVDGDILTYSIVQQPIHGAITGTLPNLTYTPASGYNGSDSFTFKATDGKLNSNIATVNLTISAINHAPIASGAALTTAEDTALPIILVATDSDNNPLTFTVRSGPSHGKLVGTAPILVYTPDANYNGPDQFSFTASDGTLASAAAIVTLTVTAVNDAPVLAHSSQTTESTVALPITLTGTDADEDPMTFSIVTQPTHGTLTGIVPNLTYTATTDFSGSDSFTFKANDGKLDSNIATVSLTVTGKTPIKENTAPVFVTSSLYAAGTEGSPLTGQLRATDVDGDALVFSKLSSPSWLSVSASGALGGTPTETELGTFSIVVKVQDAAGNSAIATLTVVVTAANHAPVFAKNPFTYPDGTEKTAYRRQSLASTASDRDAGDLIKFSLTSGPAWLSLGVDGTLGGTPPVGSAGLNRFTIRATDRLGAYSESTLEITIVAKKLPLPWTLNRLGNSPATEESATYSAGVFTLAGSGTLVDTKDAGTFGWQKVGNGGVITARIGKIEDSGKALAKATSKATGEDARVGLMIRQSLAPGARQSFIGVDGNGKLHWLSRTETNQAASDSTLQGKKSANTWLRLKRRGNTLYAYRSSDGKKWEMVASSSIKLPKNCYIGLSVSSGDDAVQNTSKFSNVRVKP